MALRPMTRRRIRALTAAAVALALVAGLAVGTSWRLAVVAALAAGAIALTRLRYSALVAVGLLVVTLALAQTGHSAGSDGRDVPARASHR
jgi:putative copper export protein